MTELVAHHVGIIVLAVILDLLLGDPRWMLHPVVFIGKLISFLERQLRMRFRSEQSGGVVLLLLTVTITVLLAWGVLKGSSALHPWLGTLVSVALAWSCLAARSLQQESGLVADALQQGNLAEARRYLSYIVGRDTAELQEPEIWRATVETVAENTSDGVIAPLLYLILGGPVLGLAYKAVNTLDSMVGYKNERYLLFGRASARFDDVANWLPARLTGLLMVGAAPLVGLSAVGAWRIMRRDGRKHASPNSGIPEAAAAGAIGVRLGGTSFYGGRTVEKPTLGEALQPLSLESYRGTVRLMFATEGLLVAVGLVLGGVLLC